MTTLWTTHRMVAPGQPAIAYDQMGEGPPVVFLHGIGGNRSNWHDQLPALAAAGFRAIAWDARGYGGSDDYDGPLEFPDFSADLARLLDHLGVDRAHLVGLSMGGRILQDFYGRHGDRATTLTLCATMPGFDKTLTPERRAEFVRLRKQPLLDGKSPEEMAPAVAKSLLGPNTTDIHYQRLVASMAALHVESYIKTVEATVMFDHHVDLPAISSPTLLVFGGADQLAKPEVGERMHQQIPGSELRILAETGHLVNLEQPEAFNRIVLDFLARRG